MPVVDIETGELVPATLNEAEEQGLLVPSYSTDAKEEGWDLEFPRFRLMHSIMDEVNSGWAQAGTFRIDGMPPLPDPLIVMPVARSKQRFYRIPKEEDKDTPLVCQSADAIVGFGEPGGDCSTCPMNQTRRCQLVQSYIILVNIPGEEPVLAKWDLAKSGYYTARRINTRIRINGFQRFALHVTAVEKANEEGRKYWAPNVTQADIPSGVLTPEVLELMEGII